MFKALTFLGTSSGVPTKLRNVSASALTFSHGGVWLFDCGEGTQHQFQRCERVSQGRVERIFITHLHGDHCYGLPGLMCTLGMLWRPKGDTNRPPAEAAEDDDGPLELHPFSDRSEFLELVGPPNLGHMLRTILSCSEAYFPFRYRVTELGGRAGDAPLHACEAPPLYIEALEDGTFCLGNIDGIEVAAGPLDHRVTSLGYVLQEPSAPGTLDMKAADALGVPRGPLLAQLKAGLSVTLPGGATVTPSQVVGAPLPGRKAVILGDTCGSNGVARLAQHADWLVHEATFDDGSAALAIPRGHSTARMAGEFAAEIGARVLLLTHFSARHAPRSKDPRDMEAMEQQARESSGVCEVRAVEDFDVVDMSRRR